MKLRSRTRRSSSNIKQEDCKPVFTPGEASAFIATDINTPKLTIKQEDTKEHKNLSKHLGQSKAEHIYKCDRCNQRMASLQSVLEHRGLIHNIQSRGRRMIKDMNMQPDIHDPNLYCKSCERGYQSKSKYREHLRCTHYMVLKQLPTNHKVLSNDILPDFNDPNLYCRSCDRTYADKNYYKKHCRYAHGMLPVDSANGKSTSNVVKDTYCQECDIRLSSIDNYRRHLFAIHKINSRTIQHNKIVPDANDPNFYCQCCEKKLATKNSFKYHLMAVHSVIPSAPRKKSKLEPDVNDLNHYCRACQKTYHSKSNYRKHLCTVHQMPLPRLIGKARPTNLPDPYSPEHYCSVCKKIYTSLGAYRIHCRRVHFMDIAHYSIIDMNAKIDTHNPDFYCAQCERSFCNKYIFKGHLRRVHNI